MESNKELSYGQKAVGITFNPGGSSSVNKIKELSAALIDELQRQNIQDARNDEQYKMYGYAIKAIQEGQMWGVKAATWQY